MTESIDRYKVMATGIYSSDGIFFFVTNQQRNVPLKSYRR